MDNLFPLKVDFTNNYACISYPPTMSRKWGGTPNLFPCFWNGRRLWAVAPTKKLHEIIFCLMRNMHKLEEKI